MRFSPNSKDTSYEYEYDTQIKFTDHLFSFASITKRINMESLKIGVLLWQTRFYPWKEVKYSIHTYFFVVLAAKAVCFYIDRINLGIIIGRLRDFFDDKINDMFICKPVKLLQNQSSCFNLGSWSWFVLEHSVFLEDAVFTTTLAVTPVSTWSIEFNRQKIWSDWCQHLDAFSSYMLVIIGLCLEYYFLTLLFIKLNRFNTVSMARQFCYWSRRVEQRSHYKDP